MQRLHRVPHATMTMKDAEITHHDHILGIVALDVGLRTKRVDKAYPPALYFNHADKR